jgi:hypothetical protein
VSSKFLTKFREQFPEAEHLGFERFIAGHAGHTIFFSRTNRRLFPENLIFAALYLANRWARKAGVRLKLTDREKRIWDRHFNDPKRDPKSRQ